MHFEKHDGSCQDPSSLENLVPPWKTSSDLLKIWSTQSSNGFSPCKALRGEADCLAPCVSLPELSLQSWSKKVISRLTDKECENATGNDWHMPGVSTGARWALITGWPGGSTCQMTHFHHIPRGFSFSLSPCTSLHWALSSDAGLLASLQALRHWVTCHQAGTWRKAAPGPPDTSGMHPFGSVSGKVPAGDHRGNNREHEKKGKEENERRGRSLQSLPKQLEGLLAWNNSIRRSKGQKHTWGCWESSRKHPHVVSSWLPPPLSA